MVCCRAPCCLFNYQCSSGERAVRIVCVLLMQECGASVQLFNCLNYQLLSAGTTWQKCCFTVPQAPSISLFPFIKINELKWEAKRFVVQYLIFPDGLGFYVLFFFFFLKSNLSVPSHSSRLKNVERKYLGRFLAL